MANDTPDSTKESKDKAGKKSKGFRLFPWFCLGLDLVLVGGLGFLYWRRPNEMAWLTSIPAWAWLFPGLLLIIFGLGRATLRTALMTLTAWIGFTGACVEESHSLVRGWLTTGQTKAAWQKALQDKQALRVVSFNCSCGNLQAIREAAGQDPDVMLFQESPSSLDLIALANTLFGDTAQVLAGADSSIIVRGKILSVTPAPESRDFVQARVRLTRSGREIEVVSLRLKPPMTEIDVWTAETRRDFADDRRYRRTALQALADRLHAVPEQLPVIIGGDFNVPAGEPCLAALKPRWRDTFEEAGAGWGNTAIDPIFGHRIDQIWVSRQFKAIRVTAGASKVSDHRMVISDLVFTDDKGRQPSPNHENNNRNSVTSLKKPLN